LKVDLELAALDRVLELRSNLQSAACCWVASGR
jgi:hypothetical protein